MARQLTEDDARESLTDHARRKGQEIRARYGPDIGWKELNQILTDREFTRYPCALVFDSAPLESGECAYPMPKGEHPEDGYVLAIHPYFGSRLGLVPLVALYQLVAVNYGDFASSADAEAFGSAVLGLSAEAYYQELCRLADAVDSLSGVPSLSRTAS